MRSHLIKSFLIFFIFTATTQAGLYKGLDAEGNVVYSDTPFENAEVLTPPEITVVDAPKIPAKKVDTESKTAAEADNEAVTKYTSLSISAPKNDQVIWNEPALMVSAKSKPALNVSLGHRAWLLLDGKPLVKNSKSLSLPIGRADRGSHTIQVQIRNKKGKILQRSKSVKIHIKNTVVQRKATRQ